MFAASRVHMFHPEILLAACGASTLLLLLYPFVEVQVTIDAANTRDAHVSERPLAEDSQKALKQE